jgi:hypothetical protein
MTGVFAAARKRPANGRPLVQAPQQQPPNFGLLILLVLCVWGALRDRSYKKAGGIRPDRFEKIYLVGTIFACLLVVMIVFFRSPEGAGTLAAVLTVAVFCGWEISRLRIRRKNPAGALGRTK